MLHIEKNRFWLGALLVGLGIVASIIAILSYAGGLNTYSIRQALRRDKSALYAKIKKSIQDNDIEFVQSAEAKSTPKLNLVLSRKDIAKFADLYQKFEDANYGVDYYAKNNQWRKAKLVYGNKTYKIKIRAHGKNPSGHKAGKYISYAVKMSENENLFNFTRFSLIIRDRIQSNRHAVRQLADHLDLIYHDLKLVKLKINSWNEKLYYLQPRFDDKFFEVKNLSSLRVFKRAVSQKDSSHKSMVNIRATTGDKFAPSIYRSEFVALLDELQYPVAQKEEFIRRHLELNDAIVNNNYNEILKYFDLEYIAAFDAFRTMMAASRHGFYIEANFHIAYDTANGKFYPIVTDDIYWRKLVLGEGQAVEEVLDGYRHKGVDSVLRFFNLLSKNDKIRNRKYEIIYRAITEAGSKLVSSHERIMAKYDRLHVFGVIQKTLRDFGMSSFPVHTQNNMTVLKKYLESAVPQVSVVGYRNGVSIQIRPNSMSALTIKSLKLARGLGDDGQAQIVVTECKNGEDEKVLGNPIFISANGDYASALDALMFSDTVDRSSKRIARRYRIDIRCLSKRTPNDSDRPFQLLLVNSVTNREVRADIRHDTRDEELIVAEGPPTHQGKTPATWLQEHPALVDCEVREGSFVIKAGVYEIEKDLVFPEGVKLVIEAGAELRLGHDVLLMGKNGIEIRGTEAEPVVIEASRPEQPFGAVGILGTSETVSEIDHLSLRGGNERLGEGVYFSGALCIYHHKTVIIRNSTIADNHADDGLNIKYADSVIYQTRFDNNFADHVDLDYSDALVFDSTFSAKRGDANGDGLDISGSTVLVCNNSFEYLNDKGVSIGERSRAFLVSNEFRNNGIGTAVKDSSIAYVVANQFLDNGVDLSLYKKKKIWSGPRCVILNAASDTRDLLCKTDAESKIIEQAISENDLGDFMARVDTAKAQASEDVSDQLILETLESASNVFRTDEVEQE